MTFMKLKMDRKYISRNQELARIPTNMPSHSHTPMHAHPSLRTCEHPPSHAWEHLCTPASTAHTSAQPQTLVHTCACLRTHAHAQEHPCILTHTSANPRTPASPCTPVHTHALPRTPVQYTCIRLRTPTHARAHSLTPTHTYTHLRMHKHSCSHPHIPAHTDTRGY